jgi:hypothetical protein
MTGDEAKIKYKNFLTVGELKKQLENYPDDTLVVSQRIEDKYFDGIDISGLTRTLPDGTIGTLPKGSKASGWDVIKKPDPLDPNHQNQYTPVWCVCHYRDDQNCLYLDLHY